MGAGAEGAGRSGRGPQRRLHDQPAGLEAQVERPRPRPGLRAGDVASGDFDGRKAEAPRTTWRRLPGRGRAKGFSRRPSPGDCQPPRRAEPRAPGSLPPAAAQPPASGFDTSFPPWSQMWFLLRVSVRRAPFSPWQSPVTRETRGGGGALLLPELLWVESRHRGGTGPVPALSVVDPRWVSVKILSAPCGAQHSSLTSPQPP